MKKIFPAAILTLMLFSGLACAGEAQNPNQAAEMAQMTQLLNNLQGMDGMHGGTSQDMTVVLSVMQSPEMLKLVSKLSAQLASQQGEMDPNAINDFVRQNLTLEDVQKILGPGVNQETLDKALSSKVDPEEVQKMLQMMTGQQPAK